MRQNQPDCVAVEVPCFKEPGGLTTGEKSIKYSGHGDAVNHMISGQSKPLISRDHACFLVTFANSSFNSPLQYPMFEPASHS